VVKYRKVVVEGNLRLAFPEKSEAERQAIAHASYKNLADLMVEAQKSLSISEEEIHQHFKVVNAEIGNKYLAQGRGVICVGGHFNNWEWGALACNAHCVKPLNMLYKKLKNKYLNDKFIKARTRMGARFVESKETYQAFSEKAPKGEPFVMVADQSPSRYEKAIWVDFLGIETACLHGPEKYAKMFDMVVLFVDIQRNKRGYYTLTLSLLTDQPNDLPDGKITQMFMGRLEEKIKENPGSWLWSHKRWKRKKDE